MDSGRTGHWWWNAGDYSGWKVSLSDDGNTVAIGAELNDGDGSYYAGHVHIYDAQ